MVQVDIPVAFAIGNIMADAASVQLRSGDPLYFHGTLLRNNIFQIFFFSWIPVYFLLNYFGWETTHMWWTQDSVMAYPYFVPVFMVLFFLSANCGFLVGNKLVREGRFLLNRAIYIGVFVFSGVWIFSQTGSTFRLGTYGEWKNGAAPWFYEDKTFFFMLAFTLVVWGAALWYFVRTLKVEGRGVDRGA